MTDELSTADESQLAVWAFGRQGVVTDPELAEAALRELNRRLEARQAAETQAAAALALDAERAAAGAETDGEHPDRSPAEREIRHRRRMLRTGIVGVVAAALALGGGVVVLTQPIPDPFSNFERVETQQDREWAQRLSTSFPATLTAGPYAIELGNGFVASVAKVSTVPDGRSTEWDAYCLYVAFGGSEKGSWSLSATCTDPEQFERDGMVVPQRPSATGGGHDVIYWDPFSVPRLESNIPLDSIAVTSSSVLDWMVNPSPTDALVSIEDLERLVMGPAVLPLSAPDGVESGVLAYTYLLAGETISTSPMFCALTVTPDEQETTACASLSTVRRQGLEFTVIADEREWVVSIDADGSDRRDTLRLAD